MARAIVTVVPPAPRRGDVLEIRTLIAHPMETGFRKDDAGAVVPRNLVTRLTCRYDGATVFAADLFSAVAANPTLVFTTVATRSGPLEITWQGDNGFAQTETVSITVA